MPSMFGVLISDSKGTYNYGKQLEEKAGLRVNEKTECMVLNNRNNEEPSMIVDNRT